MIYVFVDCRLDTHLYTLQRAGQTVRLRPKVFTACRYLLEHRDHMDKVCSEGILGWVWCRSGEAHRGVEVLTRIAALTQAVGPPVGESHTDLRLGEAYWRAGAYNSARQTLEAMLDPAEQCELPFVLASAHHLLGEIALDSNPAQREAPLAASHFKRSIALLQQLKAENELALAYAGYGRLHQQRGDVVQAHAYLTRALAIFERLGTLGEPDRIRQILAE